MKEPIKTEPRRYFGEPFKARPIEKKSYRDFVQPNADGSVIVKTDETGRGYNGRIRQTANMLFPDFRSEAELIQMYREISEHPDVDFAVEEITNEMFVTDGESTPVSLDLDEVEEIDDTTKEKIKEEFDFVLGLMNFNVDAFEIFKRFYVDSRLYYYKVVDPSKTQEGIKELRMLDPISVRKVKEIVTRNVNSAGGPMEDILEVKDFWIYVPQGNAFSGIGDAFGSENDNGFGNLNASLLSRMNSQTSPIVLNNYAIAEVNSGLFDHNKGCIKGYLHKTIKPLNDLVNLETHMIIYRVARAPERRVFYIDTGDLPPNKAQQYLNLVQDSYRREVSYDASTGRIRSDSKTISMHEDFWLPRSASGKGTNVETLSGAQNLSQIEDIEYLNTKFHTSLNVPPSRFNAENTAAYLFGASKELTREEVKFQKFVSRLRGRFNSLFKDILGTQLLLKKVITSDQWWALENKMAFVYVKDSYVEDSRSFAIFEQKIEIVKNADDLVGKYISKEYIWREILKFTDEEIELEKKRIAAEHAENPPSEEL